MSPNSQFSKYPLLFEGVLDTTPESFDDVALVEETYQRLRAVAESENKQAAEAQNFMKIFELNQLLIDYEVRIDFDKLAILFMATVARSSKRLVHFR